MVLTCKVYSLFFVPMLFVTSKLLTDYWWEKIHVQTVFGKQLTSQ